MISTSSGAGPSAPPHAPGPNLSASIPDLDSFVDEFFRYRPQTLYEAEDHTTSTGTRPPAFFDRHLDPQLQLLRVAYLPSITTDLMNIADEALKNAQLNGTLPPLDERRFPTEQTRMRSIPAAVTQIIAEGDIEKIYKKTTAKFCSLVAATLEFQLPTWNPGHLAFTLKSDKKRGIADGFLTLGRGPCNSNTVLTESYNSVAETFPTLALWEFKSLTAGSLDVMEAIVQQAVSCLAFPWVGCKHGKGCVVDAKHVGKDGLPAVTGARMGLDAEPPTCRSVKIIVPGTPSGPSVPLSNHARIGAAHITQQTWGEAVQEDVTFVIINSGNFEIIGIRNRKQQTLYVSDVIRVDSCDYGRLHTGLYIAILRDAVDRTRLLKPPNIPASWTKSYTQQAPKKMTATEILNQAYLRDWLVMHASSKKISLTGFKLNECHFRGSPSKELKDNTLPDLWSLVRINLNTELGHFIAKGTLEVDGNRLKNPSCAVIVKVAHTDDAIMKLRREHEVYLTLSKAGVTEIPRVIGFFQYVDIEETEESPLCCAALVMQDMGSPVCHVPEGLTRQRLTLFQNLLSKIHRAGIVHTKLSRENLLIREGGSASVSIVSFGNAQNVAEGRKSITDAEYKHLLELLPNPSKHTADGESTKAFQDTFPIATTPKNRDDESPESQAPRKKGRRKTFVPPGEGRSPARRSK